MLMLTTCGQATPTAEPTQAAGTLAAVSDHFEKGNEFSRAGDFAKAVEEYQKALDIEPEDVDTMTNLGVAFYNLGQLNEAVEQYLNAVELAPNDADIHSNLAAAYVQLHQLSGESTELDQALAEYQKAIELNPNLSQAHFGLGVVYSLMGQNEAAIEALKEFQKLDSGEDPMATQYAEEYLRQLEGQ